jgi:5-methylcytosine-specific restriction endonuclease McrA
VRRAVWQRDGGRCTYVSRDGERCRETACLELHHETPYARGGPPTESNLRLICRSHNALAAEADYGREFMARKACDRGAEGVTEAGSG